MSVFNLSTDKNSGNMIPKEGVDYITVTDGNGGEIKILNLENEDLAPRTGLVEITPLKISWGFMGAVRHQNEVHFKNIRDRRTGWLIGIPLAGFTGRNKEIKFEPFTIRGTEVFDLSIPKDRLKWICIKHSSFLKGSPNFLQQSKTIYEHVDRERQATEFHLNRKNKRKASEIAESLHGQDLIDMALALNLGSPKTMSTSQLEMAVINFAENTNKVNGKTGADIFLEVYNSETRLELTILNRAITTGVVSLDRQNGYTFNGVSLGFSEFEAVHFLKKSPQLMNSIDLRASTLNDSTVQAYSEPKAPVLKDEKDAEIERMKKEMEAMQSRLAKANEIAAEAVGDKEINDIDPELSDLIAEAKRLQIGAPHLIGRKDDLEVRKQKIRDKIASAKKSVEN